jgi:pimeloyl-ACP methyl ester carboxylesterase
MLRRLALALGLSWLLWRLFGPDPIPRSTTDQRRPMKVPGRTVFVGRHEFFVRELGDPANPPLILIHGWNFDGEMAFHKLMPILADRYRVIVPDLRNHGKSDRIRGRFEIADAADEVNGVIEALGIARPVPILGYSMGGMVLQELAIRHPSTPSAIVLGATAARPMHRLRPVSWLIFRMTRALARISRAELVWGSFLLLRRGHLITPADEAWMWESLLARDANLYHEAAYAMWRFDARDRVGSIDVPTLVVIPERDTVVPIAAQEELASLIPEAEVVRMTDVGHESILSDPATLAGVVVAFLDRAFDIVNGDGEA